MKASQYISIEGMIYLIILAVISALLGLVLPFSILIIFDRVIPNSAETTLWFLYLIIVGAIFVDIKLQSIEEKYTSLITKKYEQEITANIFQALCRANISKFHSMTIGEYLERIRAIGSLRSYYGGDSIKTIINGITCTIIIAIIAIINIYAGGVLLMASCVLLLIANYLSRQKVDNLQSKSSLEGYTNSKIIEIVSHPLNLKSAAMEFRLENFMDDAVNRREDQSIRSEKIESRFPLSLEYVQQLSVACVVVVCAMSVIGQDMSQGGMAAIILLTNRYFAPYRHIMTMKGQKRVNLMQLKRLQDILTLEVRDVESDSDSDEKNAIDLTPKKIEVTGDQFYKFRRGNIYIINGPSCHGKTRLMQAIALGSRDEDFTINVNGKSIERFGYNRWKNLSVMVNRDSSFIEGTIIENITCFRPKLYRSAHALCDAMGIKDIIDRLPRGFYTELKGTKNYPFSRQVHFSLLIIRALLCQKSILIIDDIDQFYDDNFGQNIIRCIESRVDSMTCFFVSNKIKIEDRTIIHVPIEKIISKTKDIKS